MITSPAAKQFTRDAIQRSEAFGLSHAEFARAMGTAHTQVSVWNARGSAMSFPLALRAAALLGMDLNTYAEMEWQEFVRPPVRGKRRRSKRGKR